MAGVIILDSCRKLIEVDPPKDRLVTSEVFSDSSNATAAVLGIYADMVNRSTYFGFNNGGLTLYPALSSDEMHSTLGDPVENEFQFNALTAANSLNQFLWTGAYKTIYEINACIENLAASKGISLPTKNQLTGECLFLRAYIYFNLVNIYGPVPYVNGSDYSVNATLARTATDSIYTKIVSDLLSAEDLLTDNFISGGKIRPNKGAAIALLARVYLYTRQWEKAENNAGNIINSSQYFLESNLDDVFLAGSDESIWQLPPLQKGFETAEGYQFVPYASDIIPYYVINDRLVNTFEPGDQRKQKWMGSNVVDGVTYYYPFKYKLGYDGNNTPQEYYTLLRFSEQYLIRAEARAMQNNLTGAVDDMNMIRVRVNLPEFNSNDQSVILTAIQHERQTEFFCECGHRWFDLKRTGTVNAVLGLLKPGWQERDALYPVPLDEIFLNPTLVQSPGY